MPRFLRPKTTRSSASRILAGGVAALLLGGAGCLLQASYSVSVTTADGVKLEVPLNGKKIVVADDAITVNRFQFTPWKMEEGKGLAYAIEIEFKKGARPVAIAVDDVTEEPIIGIYADNNPKLREGTALWRALSTAYPPADEHAKWIMTLDNGVKVYRFTVKLADGSTHVLRYPIFVPGSAKAFMRAQLGVG